MGVLTELFQILFDALRKFSPKEIALYTTLALALGAGCWAFCNYYVRLWNKRFYLAFTHQLLSIIASALCFLFVLAFFSAAFLEEIALVKIALWREDLKTNQTWEKTTFKEAYYAVKELNVEDFTNSPTPEQDGTSIPIKKNESQIEAASVYANSACRNFDENHPLLSKIIWSSPTISKDIVTDDIKQWFSAGNEVYPDSKAIDLASEQIKTELKKQAPRVVKLARIALVILFFVTLLIPLSLIGFAAYKDIKVHG